MPVWDVYLLALHAEYSTPEHPVPINATVVHAQTLLHPALPQPDGGLIYRCLTEFPVRTPGCIVPLSTLTFELAGGLLWPEVGDWEAVVHGLVALSRSGQCDAMPIGLPHLASELLVNGPNSTVVIHHADGRKQRYGGLDRQHQLNDLTRLLHSMFAMEPMWPGDNLLTPPVYPQVLPYQPGRPRN